MATLPQFLFPLPKETNAPIQSPAIPKPSLQVQTKAEIYQDHRLAVPGRRYSRPPPLRALSTPPDSPTRLRSSTMGAQDFGNTLDSRTITPPLTPINSSHSKTNSASSDFLATLSSLRRGDSTSSRTGPRASIDESLKPSNTELLTFPRQSTDYQFRTDGEGKKKPIGAGLWSDVYLATPCPAKSNDPFSPAGADMTPPITPVHSRDSSFEQLNLLAAPPLYAIKVPASTSAKKVLSAEARILSYLSRFPDAECHTVPFFGQDTRTSALVLKAMDGTLEEWIEKELNTLDEASRAQRLITVFPSIAKSLFDSLLWMQDKDCIHADIKPSNILVSSSSSAVPKTVYSDFSSSILTIPSLGTNIETSPVGAGTWDYLDPSLLSSLSPASPSATTDLWSLAITLLFLVLGSSPYDAFKGNKFQQREMIKSGAPLQALGYSNEGLKDLKRLKTLSKHLGFDLHKWFAKVLVKGMEKRASVKEWKEELERAMVKGIARM